MKTLLSVMLLCATAAISQPQLHNQKHHEWLITNAMIVAGVGTPAEGPYDIHIKAGRIHAISGAKDDAKVRQLELVQLDAEGGYVLPGFINMHAHTMYNRAGIDMAQPYQHYLWLASGITTVRDLGSDTKVTLKEREQSAAGEIIAPRMFVYPGIWGNQRKEDLDKTIKKYHKQGVDGLKFGMMDKETFHHASKIAAKYDLKIANHVGVEDMTAWDNIEAGTTTIEHWYGVPDAALKGVQNFPPDMNYSNELHRFRYAGRLWQEADQEKLQAVLQGMVDAGVAWNPTLVIYEASRDLQRATSSPWFQDYLHPGLEKFFKPSADSHGSFFWGWTSTDEVYWKNNYQIWFKALRDFAEKGGIITTGEDGGYIYQLFGFGYLRELMLHQEAGFHPLEVIKHATVNSAKVLGEGDRLGQVRIGYSADLVIINGNPMADLSVLWPRNIKPLTGDESTGGILWTIKAGVPYHAPTMLKAVREMVKTSRAEHKIGYLVD
ncbi:amidohydrolase family protein [Marinicella sp. S1101]|uniref:amidohydrolase family protein n=1 Tax=Marinicella marina TaxID=2996016 RepID=UPI0022608F0E|nr:amidohydrolase family protein [Marinicella marina]MCX7553223.1 amidohydrolase family protein [Marinicella marina]MDJ1138955.1 amidohydrolase family protein [Marinicella marina]